MRATVRKNLLDLEYSKYLQFYNTSIIILGTYLVGVFIAISARQVDVNNPVQLEIIQRISVLVICLAIFCMLNFRFKLDEITKNISKLKI